VVQVAPINPTLKAPGSMLSKLGYVEPPSNYAFKINLRRFNPAPEAWRLALLSAVGGVAVAVGPDGWCSPRHTMMFHSRNEGSRCVEKQRGGMYHKKCGQIVVKIVVKLWSNCVQIGAGCRL